MLIRLSSPRQMLTTRRSDARTKPSGYFGDAFFNAAIRRANNLKDAFLMARSLVLKRELREGFEPSHPQMAGGGKVGPLLMAHPLGIPGVE
jgi:hypothetical protein